MTRDSGQRATGTVEQRTKGIEPRTHGRGQEQRENGRVEWADDTRKREEVRGQRAKSKGQRT
jgi:hypothetical protein